MSSDAQRYRLAYPVAAVVALGLVTVPHAESTTPRLVEASSVRLAAEVSSAVGGLTDLALVRAAAAAPAAATAPSDSWPDMSNYSWLDQAVAKLPPKLRQAVVYGLAFVGFGLGSIVQSVGMVIQAVLKPIQKIIKPKAASIPSAAAVAAGNSPAAQPIPVAAAITVTKANRTASTIARTAEKKSVRKSHSPRAARATRAQR